MSTSRRKFLGMASAGAASTLFPDLIRQALAVPAYSATGTLADVQHVVIFMQENRSFDHYFGTLAGVRGFNDPRAITLPGGKAGLVPAQRHWRLRAAIPFRCQEHQRTLAGHQP